VQAGLGHAVYALAACTGWMHADLHPGNFLRLPGGRLGMLDFGAVAAVPGGIPAPFGQLGATVPTRGFHLAYSPGFRDGVLGAQRLFPRADQTGRKTGTDG
jgi:hypothetical protein